jgi:hypothetical protein
MCGDEAHCAVVAAHDSNLISDNIGVVEHGQCDIDICDCDKAARKLGPLAPGKPVA